VAFLLSASAGDTSAAFAEEGVGPACGNGGFAENPGQAAVAV
jgi:hypothetical protein